MRSVVELAMRGDHEAFGLLVDSISDRMYGIVSLGVGAPGRVGRVVHGFEPEHPPSIRAAAVARLAGFR